MTILNWKYSFDCMQQSTRGTEGEFTKHWTPDLMMSIGDSSRATNNKGMGKRAGKRPGRKPSKIDEHAKLERSRQSARECRARKKLRYQYLEELVLNREKAVFALRDELETYKQWCFSLEHGGQLPESLLKMLASDDVSLSASETEQVKRSHLQYQFHFSSSSSSASSASPDVSPVGQSNSQTLRSQTFEPQSRSAQHSVLHNSIQESFSNQQPLQDIQQAKAMSSAAPLQRQMAFDHSNNYQKNQLQEINSPGQIRTQNFASHLPSSNQLQQQLLLQNHSGQTRTTNSVVQKAFSLPQSNNLQIATNSWKSEDSMLCKEKKDIPNYNTFFNELNTFPKIEQNNLQNSQEVSLQRAGEPSRRRSLSNPASMITHPRSNTHTTSNYDLPSSLQDFITSHDRSRPTNNQEGSFLGLFSGNLIEGSPNSLQSLIPTSVNVEDSSSLNETMDVRSSDQSLQNSQKRKQIFSALFENSKRSIPVVNNVSVNQMSSNIDPQHKNTNQSNVSFFDITNTSKMSQTWSSVATSSMAPPVSNQRYSEVLSSTASSSRIELPTPLSSLSLLLEQYAVSPGLSSTAFDIATPTACHHNVSSQINSAGLNNFNHDTKPEWYSFIDDLHDGTTSYPNPCHMTTTSITSTTASNLQGQLLVPSSSFMNVPNIIDEILDSNDP